MYVIRPIKSSDADAFVQLAFEAGLGLISIPKNPELLHAIIQDSERSFSKKVVRPTDESYLFALVDIQSNTLGGVSGIHAKTGLTIPSTFFHIEKTPRHNPLLGREYEMSALKVVHYSEGPSEICSLYLSRSARHSGLGRLLSLSRLLFMASFLERMNNMVFADMRGVVLPDNHCPFWSGIGRHFLNMDYASLMQMKNMKNFSIADQLPEWPIYIPLLPEEVQQSIGKVHTNTKPALNMLMQEGFCFSDDISIYDGGPKIEVETKEIYTVKHSIVATVDSITSVQQDDVSYLISNNDIDFRCCFGKVTLTESRDVVLSTNVAAALHVDVGSKVRFIQHHMEKKL